VPMAAHRKWGFPAILLWGLRHWCFINKCYDRFKGVVRQVAYFLIGAVLYGMRDVDRQWVAAQGFGLRPGRIGELVGGYKDTGDASAFQVDDVMHTA
jgi:hypothetical protein